MPQMLKIPKTRRNILRLWSCAVQGITEGVKKQAEQRISSRFIMYVLGVHDLILKKTQRGRRNGKSAESQKLKRARDYWNSAQKSHLRNNRGALLRA